MRKFKLQIAIAISFIALISCSGQKTELAIEREMDQKCRDGSMRYIDSYECANLVMDKYISIAGEEFRRKKPVLLKCVGEENTQKLMKINADAIEILEKTRPSLWSRFIPFVSPKNSIQSRREEMEKSDAWIESEMARKIFIKNLEDSQVQCLGANGVRSLNLVSRRFE